MTTSPRQPKVTVAQAMALGVKHGARAMRHQFAGGHSLAAWQATARRHGDRRPLFTALMDHVAPLAFYYLADTSPRLANAITQSPDHTALNRAFKAGAREGARPVFDAKRPKAPAKRRAATRKR